MKNKKQFVLLLSLILCMLALPMSGLAAGSQERQNNSAASVKIGDATTYYYSDFSEALTAANTGIKTAPAILTLLGNIDLTATAEIAAGAYVTLDLNGQVLSGSSIREPVSDGDKASVIYNQGNLTIKDSSPNETHYFNDSTSVTGLWVWAGKDAASGTHTVTGGVIAGGIGTYSSYSYYGGGIYNAGTLTMSGGTISGNKAQYDGGGIYNKGGTLTIDGGTISGNRATDGGGIRNFGTLTMSGGTISGNTAHEGGGIRNFGTLTMSDGTISGNTAYKDGGGICNTGTLTMSGGTISGNKAGEGDGDGDGGGVFNSASGSSFTVGGTTKITGNKNAGGAASNFYIGKNNNDFGLLTISTTDPLIYGASIGVSYDSGNKTITKGGTTDDEKKAIRNAALYGYIFCDNGESMAFVTDHLEAADKKAEISSQQDPLTYGTGGSTDYVLTYTTGWTPGTCSVGWMTDSLPAGVTTAFDQTNSRLTITAAGNTPAGTYQFKIVADGVFSAEGTLTVGKAKVKMPEAKSDLVYNGTEQTGVEEPSDAVYDLSGHKATHAGSYTATVSLRDKNNYEWATVPATDDQSISWSIGQKAIIVTPDPNQSKVYGAEDPVLTYTSAGAVTGETAAFDGKLSRAEGEDAGNYSITIGSLALKDNDGFIAGNYTLVLNERAVNFTITQVEAAASPNTGITSNSTALPAVVGLIVLAAVLTFVVVRRRQAK